MAIEKDLDRDIVESLGAHYGIEPAHITEGSTLDDLGRNSLKVSQIAEIVENSPKSTRRSTASRSTTSASRGVRTFSAFGDLIKLKRGEKAARSTSIH